MISPDGIAASLSGTIFREIIFSEVVDSTNTVALTRADSGAKEGLVVLAESQTGGRGRHGRLWHSPPGKNITMSLLLRPGIKTLDASSLTLLAAVAACDSLREGTDLDIRIKWPNDVVLDRKKLGGILIDTRTENSFVTIAVIGIGMNINIREYELPDEIKNMATSLCMRTGLDYDRNEIISTILKKIDTLYRNLFEISSGEKIKTVNTTERKSLINRWKELDVTLGKEITVTTARGTLRGKALDIDEYGMLEMLTHDGKIEKIHTGDISFDE
jgi:BirA family biotin operon repressor/biotin-[acetyl-CoA-carboxylase] ligase